MILIASYCTDKRKLLWPNSVTLVQNCIFAFCFKFAYSVIEKTQPVISVLRRAASRSFFNNDGSHFVFSDGVQTLSFFFKLLLASINEKLINKARTKRNPKIPSLQSKYSSLIFLMSFCFRILLTIDVCKSRNSLPCMKSVNFQYNTLPC